MVCDINRFWELQNLNFETKLKFTIYNFVIKPKKFKYFSLRKN